MTKTHEQFIKDMNEKNDKVEVLGNYTSAHDYIKVKCKTCGFEWEGVPRNMLSGDGCRKCGAKKAHEKAMKSTKWIKDEIQKLNPNVEIIGEYRGRHYPIKARCKICGYEWDPIVSSLLRGSNHKESKTIHKLKK